MLPPLTISRFPDPLSVDDDIIAVSHSVRPELLADAYQHGIFPWPMDGMEEIPWVSPLDRGVLFFDELHVPRSLEKARRRSSLRFTIDHDFDAVIAACAEAERPDQPGTWITPEMVAAYREFHRLGHAHSVEAWRDDALVGGVYGVDANGLFGAESMFFREDNASKLCLLHLFEHLRARGSPFLDIQVVTPHMERLGARKIPREDFLARLAAEQKAARKLF